MVELVDTQVLGTCAVRLRGSSPLESTNMNDKELPRVQYHFKDINALSVEIYTFTIQKLMRDLPFNPTAIRTAIDLYCGNGVFVAGELGYLPKATIHAVDIHENILAPYLQKQKRVKFHQGWVSEILFSDQLPKADFISISFASRHHGLNNMSASKLQKLTAGYLVTVGDNAGLEQEPYFRELFTMVKSIPDYFAAVWKAK